MFIKCDIKSCLYIEISYIDGLTADVVLKLCRVI